MEKPGLGSRRTRRHRYSLIFIANRRRRLLRQWLILSRSQNRRPHRNLPQAARNLSPRHGFLAVAVDAEDDPARGQLLLQRRRRKLNRLRRN